MDDLKSTDSPTSGVAPQSPVTPAGPGLDDQAVPKPTPPKSAPAAPPTTQPGKPPESPPQIVTTQTTTTETPKESKLSGRFPKSPKKKIIAGVAVLLMVVLGGISVATAWRLTRVEKVTPGEAEASVGTRDHCKAVNCKVEVGPDNIAFEIKGHGTKNTSTPMVNLAIPAGSTMYKAYAIWGGDRQASVAKDKNFSLKVNNKTPQQVTAQADYSGYIEQYDVKVDSFLADITSLLPTNPTSFTFKVTGGLMEGYIDDGGGGGGHGISFIVIYKKSTNPYNKIVIKLWGEFVMRNVSANMPFNIGNRRTGSNNLRAAFFFGEGEGSTVGDTRPNALFYNEDNDRRLNPTDGTAFPAWGSEPGNWWDARITGGNLPGIKALANTATFHTQSYPPARNEQGKLGDSFTWTGGLVEYEMESPPVPGCWEACTNDEDCSKTPDVLLCQDVEGTKRCVNPVCPSQENCGCPPLLCLDLTSSSEELLEGDEVQLTCKGSYNTDQPVNYAEFKVLVDGQQEGNIEKVDATAANGDYEAVLDYTIPKTGNYRIECRVCGEDVSVSYDNGNVSSSVDFKCTEWGKAGVAE